VPQVHVSIIPTRRAIPSLSSTRLKTSTPLAMPGRIKSKSTPTEVAQAVGHIFEQAQLSTANHRKNFVTLSKLHLEAATQIDHGSSKIGPEDAFELLLLDMIMRVIPLKKGTPVVERTIKFCSGYLKFISQESQGWSSHYSTVCSSIL